MTQTQEVKDGTWIENKTGVAFNITKIGKHFCVLTRPFDEEVLGLGEITTHLSIRELEKYFTWLPETKNELIKEIYEKFNLELIDDFQYIFSRNYEYDVYNDYCCYEYMVSLNETYEFEFCTMGTTETLSISRIKKMIPYFDKLAAILKKEVSNDTRN